MQEVAFEGLERAIVASGLEEEAVPHSVLRSDEIVWARAPARLDIGGGWTDTPPYSLEWGGCVTNAAVDLNGQPPDPGLRAGDRRAGDSDRLDRPGRADRGARVRGPDGLPPGDGQLRPGQSGDGPFRVCRRTAAGPGRRASKKILEAFGGGIELTTLAAIPKGSGLGTSSIMGAVIVAVLGRVMGRQLSQRELFHSVLRLEQALTTGGGWQDQIGGVVDGVKMIVTEPGLVPDAHIHYVPVGRPRPESQRRPDAAVLHRDHPAGQEHPAAGRRPVPRPRPRRDDDAGGTSARWPATSWTRSSARTSSGSAG